MELLLVQNRSDEKKRQWEKESDANSQAGGKELRLGVVKEGRGEFKYHARVLVIWLLQNFARLPE